MSNGHIKIDSRFYQLASEGAITRSNANQVSAKIGSSAGDYDDLTEWNNFVMEDWRAGVGKRNPEDGGFLFSTMDTRFEGQIMPCQLLEVGTTQTGASSVVYQSSRTTTTIGSGQTYTRLADEFTLTSSQSLGLVTVLLPTSGGTATQAKVELWSDTAGLPNAMLQSVTVTLASTELEYDLHLVEFTVLGPPVGTTTYYVVIYPVSGTMPMLTFASSGYGYDGAAWAAGPSPYFFVHRNAPIADTFVSAVSFNNYVYVAAGTKLYQQASDAVWTLQKTFGASITSLLPVGDKLYIGLGDSTNYQTMNTSHVFDTTPSVPARLFSLSNGLLWRAVDDSVYYTADETTWSDAIVVAASGYLVRGMAGLQGEMIVSTDNALYRIAAGDVVLLVSAWAGESSANGAYMLNFQGNLYISQGQSLLRYDGASLLPFGVDLGEGLPAKYAGNVVALAANNNWMILAVAGATYSTVWAHNGQGWHCLAHMPAGSTIIGLAYLRSEWGGGGNRPDNVLRMITAEGGSYRIRLYDSARSLYNFAQSGAFLIYTPFSVMTTDWFYGGLREVQKDFESVYIDGDNLSSNRYVKVYWQDDGSSDWESLGTVDSDGEELRWSNYSTRPASKRIKFKFVFYYGTGAGVSGVRVNAIRIKYRPMIRDRWRWTCSVVIPYANKQEVGGTVQTTYTQAQTLAHLDGLTKQVPPFILQDTDDAQYEVMMLDASRQPTKFEYLPGSSAKRVEYVYNLVMEQVQPSAYSP